jgi:hypothetical protein
LELKAGIKLADKGQLASKLKKDRFWGIIGLSGTVFFSLMDHLPGRQIVIGIGFSKKPAGEKRV